MPGKNAHRMKSAEPHGGLSIHRAGEMIGEGAPMSSVVTMLGVALGRPVLDETGLKGGFDFKLEWSPDIGSSGLSNKPGAAAAPWPSAWPRAIRWQPVTSGSR